MLARHIHPRFCCVAASAAHSLTVFPCQSIRRTGTSHEHTETLDKAHTGDTIAAAHTGYSSDRPDAHFDSGQSNPLRANTPRPSTENSRRQVRIGSGPLCACGGVCGGATLEEAASACSCARATCTHSGGGAARGRWFRSYSRESATCSSSSSFFRAAYSAHQLHAQPELSLSKSDKQRHRSAVRQAPDRQRSASGSTPV